MLWAQSRFLEAMLKVNLSDLFVSDLALEHVHNLLPSGTTDVTRAGGGILEMELLAHDWKLAV